MTGVSSSTPDGRSSARWSRTRMPTMPAAVAGVTSRRRRGRQRAPGPDGAGGGDRRRGIRRDGRDQRGPGLAPPGGAHPGLGAGAGRAPGRGLGGLGRLQGRGRPTCCAVRAGAVPRLHHGVDVRAADLPMAVARRRCSTRSTPGGGATRTRAGRACSSATRSARPSGCSRGSIRSIGPIYTHGAVEALNRAYRERGRRSAVDDLRGGGREGDRLVAGPRSWRLRRPTAPPGSDGSARPRRGSPRAGCASAAPGGGSRSIAASSSPITPTGPACSEPSRPPGPRASG